MTITRIKLIVAAALLLPFLTGIALKAEPVTVAAGAVEFAETGDARDTPAVYKAQCAMCHTPAAAKFFDLEKTDEEHVEVILKGKKAEKPPHMPGYEAKGMTPEEAKALVVYMRELRAPKP